MIIPSADNTATTGEFLINTCALDDCQLDCTGDGPWLRNVAEFRSKFQMMDGIKLTLNDNRGAETPLSVKMT
jgi:hypothetical protein